MAVTDVTTPDPDTSTSGPEKTGANAPTPTTTTREGSLGDIIAYPQTQNDYRKIGWRTFPVVNGTKEPAAKGWQEWEGEIGAFSNIGIVTGAPSGIIVLDVDDRHSGWQSLAEMEEHHGRLPETLRAATANGGAHFYFKHPGTREVRNGQRIYGKPGLDIRGDGGYVVVPPSKLGEKRYTWDIESPTELAEAPAWVVTHGENRVREVELSEDIKNPPGTHHDAMLRVSGSLRYFGAPQHILEKFLLDYNQAKNDPPCPEQEVLDLARDAAKRWKQGHKPVEPPKVTTLSLPANEFVSLETKPMAWLIQGIWPEEAIGFIAGMGKSYKSFMALELAYSIAVGALFLGQYKVPEPRKVLLIQQESSLGAYQVRVANMSRRLGEAPNLHIVSNKHLSLESKVDVERMENEIARVRPALVVLDPLASFLHGDENSAQNMGEVVGTLRKLRDDHGCGIAIVHHNRKDGTALRGSTALFNAFEVLIKMKRTNDRDALTSDVDIELKEFEGPYPFTVTLDSQTTALMIGDIPEKLAERQPSYPQEDPEQQDFSNYYSDEDEDERGR